MPSIPKILQSIREARIPAQLRKHCFRVVLLALVACGCWLPATAEGSDPVGIYALVDKVVFEPNPEQPTHVQVHGAFCSRSEVARRQYDPPLEGYLYMTVATDKVEQCRSEWRDLERVAGKGVVVGLGSRWDAVPRVRHATPATDADIHPLQFGVRKLSEKSEYEPNRWLRYLPRPVRAEFKQQGVELVVKRCAADEKVMYLFELESPAGEILGSPPMPVGEDGTARWLCPWRCVPGKKYRWRVRILPSDEGRQKNTFAVAQSTFDVPQED